MRDITLSNKKNYQKQLIVSFAALIISLNVHAGAVYFYTNKLPSLVPIRIKIYEGAEKIGEISNGDLKVIQMSSESKHQLTFKWSGRVSKSILIDFSKRQTIFIHINLDPYSWTVGEEYYPNLQTIALNEYEIQFNKSKAEENPSRKEIPSDIKSGTGFALTQNGLIVTNYHVVEGSKVIRIKVNNDGVLQYFNADILVSDRNNDLALLKISPNQNFEIDEVPFTIKKNGSAQVGESVFLLGYPLRVTMGDNIKLTNGIISSKSGFQGDVTSYQISAPIQPGNSGGPLFSDKAELVVQSLILRIDYLK